MNYIILIIIISLTILSYESILFIYRLYMHKKDKKRIWSKIETNIKKKENKKIHTKLKRFILLYIEYMKLVQHYDLYQSIDRFCNVANINVPTKIKNRLIHDLLKCNKIKRLNKHNVPPSNRKLYFYQIK